MLENYFMRIENYKDLKKLRKIVKKFGFAINPSFDGENTGKKKIKKALRKCNKLYFVFDVERDEFTIHKNINVWSRMEEIGIVSFIDKLRSNKINGLIKRVKEEVFYIESIDELMIIIELLDFMDITYSYELHSIYNSLIDLQSDTLLKVGRELIKSNGIIRCDHKENCFVLSDSDGEIKTNTSVLETVNSFMVEYAYYMDLKEYPVYTRKCEIKEDVVYSMVSPIIGMGMPLPYCISMSSKNNDEAILKIIPGSNIIVIKSDKDTMIKVYMDGKIPGEYREIDVLLNEESILKTTVVASDMGKTFKVKRPSIIPDEGLDVFLNLFKEISGIIPEEKNEVNKDVNSEEQIDNEGDANASDIALFGYYEVKDVSELQHGEKVVGINKDLEVIDGIIIEILGRGIANPKELISELVFVTDSDSNAIHLINETDTPNYRIFKEI